MQWVYECNSLRDTCKILHKTMMARPMRAFYISTQVAELILNKQLFYSIRGKRQVLRHTGIWVSYSMEFRRHKDQANYISPSHCVQSKTRKILIWSWYLTLWVWSKQKSLLSLKSIPKFVLLVVSLLQLNVTMIQICQVVSMHVICHNIRNFIKPHICHLNTFFIVIKIIDKLVLFILWAKAFKSWYRLYSILYIFGFRQNIIISIQLYSKHYWNNLLT